MNRQFQLSMMIKTKPLKRFLPEFCRQPAKEFRDSSNLQPQTNVISNETDRGGKMKNTTNVINPRFVGTVVKAKEMKEFFKLTEDPVINNFLKMDSCKRVADKYLIAMVFAYFKRANFSTQDFNKTNFFVALYLANDVEEDDEETKYEIFPWALGENWRDTYGDFLKRRDWLFRRLDFKAIISRKCCDEIMSIEPDNMLWKRERWTHHAGAVRGYMRDPKDNGMPRGPDGSPFPCTECDLSDGQSMSSGSEGSSWLVSP